MNEANTWSAAIAKKNQQRRIYKAELLAGSTVRAAAKAAGIDMMTARLWAGEPDIKDGKTRII